MQPPDDLPVTEPPFRQTPLSTQNAVTLNQCDDSAASNLKGSTPEESDPTQRIATPTEKKAETAPTIIGSYQILGEIARGGMGVVYRAREIRTRRPVALKMILAGQFATADSVARFHAEARAAANLDHPGIVPIYEVGELDGKPYFTMPLITGGSLNELLRAGPLPPEATARLMKKVAEAVQYAHDKGIIHRDIKPHNILLQQEDSVHEGVTGSGLTTDHSSSGSVASFSGPVPRLTDFGLARAVAEEGVLTASGEVMGTPSYMPPEQASGDWKHVGPQSDVYSLGAVLYCLLTGRPPFQAATAFETMRQVREQEPVSPRHLNPGVPRDLETVCLKCLAKEPRRRYTTAAEFAAELERFLTGHPVLARPVGTLERALRWCGRNKTVASLGAAVVVLLLVGTCVSTWLAIRAIRAQNDRAIAQVDALLEANHAAVPNIIAGLTPFRSVVDPYLRDLQGRSGLNERERTRVALALLPVDDSVLPFLRERMLEAEPEEVIVLRDALSSHGEVLKADLWKEAADAPAVDRRFRAAVALARFDPESDRWGNAADNIIKPLLDANALHLGLWTEALRPVRASLIAPLTRVFHDDKAADKKQTAATILADYADDQPQVLAELFMDADARQAAVLWPKLLRHRDQMVAAMTAELDRVPTFAWPDSSLDPNWTTPAADLCRRIETASGLVQERFALCQGLPLKDFPGIAEELRRSGYRPINFRPYNTSKEIAVAAVWQRDGRNWDSAHDLTAEEVRARNVEMRARGLLPLDIASYLRPVEGKGQTAAYAVLWAARDDQTIDAQLDVGVADDEHQVAWEPPRKGDMIPRTLADLVVDGNTFHSAVYWKPAKLFDINYWRSNYTSASYQEFLNSGYFQHDVRIHPTRKGPTGRELYTKMLHNSDAELKVNPEALVSLYRRGMSYCRLGQDQKALEDLSKYIEKNPKPLNPYRFRALANARLGKKEEAKKDLAEFLRQNRSASLRVCWDAFVTAHLGEDEAAMERVEAEIKRRPKDVLLLYDAAWVYAGISQAIARKNPDRSETYARRAIALVKEALVGGYTNYALLTSDIDLDAIRHRKDFAPVLALVPLDRQFSAVWHDSTAAQSIETHGLDMAAHLTRCRELAAQGYRPAALSTVELAEGRGLVTASVWHRPVVTEKAKNALALRQARAAAALLRAGAADRVWPLFAHRADPRIRSYLIHQLAVLGLDPGLLIDRIGKETNISARRALILSLGEFGDAIPADRKTSLGTQLLEGYRENPDPGLHSAIDWLLRRQWGRAADLDATNRALRSEPPGKRQWYVNGQGQTMALIPGPVEFQMGSPPSEPYRGYAERPHRRRISRSFAIATKKVTLDEFQRFLQLHPEIIHSQNRQHSPEGDCPVLAITWLQAAAYCRWLSEEEGIAEEEMVYPPIPQIREGMVLPANYLSRTSYRLPSEAEWEYACRAGAVTSRFYGSGDDLLDRYVWYARNCDGRTWPVGQLKPNDLGLFDPLGNSWDWIGSANPAYPVLTGNSVAEDPEYLLPIVHDRRMNYRGGSYYYSYLDQIRSAYRHSGDPTSNYVDVGLRPVRTYRPGSFDPLPELLPAMVNPKEAITSPMTVTRSARLMFVNKGKEDAQIYWASRQGKLIPYMLLPPGDTWTARTFVDDVWVVEQGRGLRKTVYVTPDELKRIVLRDPAR
jgi:serine/threonine protein kinase/formylglycine-generating enzyme required for sulfatase activity/tetratricopeptide (TPR) repeat protein